MRFSTLLPALTLLTTLFAPLSVSARRTNRSIRTPTTRDAAQAIDARSVSPNTSGLVSDFEKRQGGVVTVNFCLTVGAGAEFRIPNNLLGITLPGTTPVVLSTTQAVCLCFNNDALTPTSLDRIRAFLGQSGNTSITLLGLNIGVVTQAIADIYAALFALPADRPAACNYPVGSTPLPESLATCGCRFTCPTGQNVCNNRCTTIGQCPSGVPTSAPNSARRRGLSANLLCPQSFSACAVSGSRSGLYECLDTSSDVETCGGCEYPLKGEKKGQDCTTIENTSSVACVSGKCIVQSCLKGFIAVGQTCVMA